MPRSFLVKKPYSSSSSSSRHRHRVPNDDDDDGRRRLDTRLGRPDPSLAVWHPLALQEGTSGPAAPIKGDSLWDRCSVIACLSPPLPPKSDLGGDPALGLPGDASATSATTDNQALDFRDPQGQSPLPLPPTFRLPQRRTPSLGSPAEGEGSKALVGGPDPATAPAGPLERLGCPDCPKTCDLFLGSKGPTQQQQQQQQRCRQVGPARKYFSCKYCDKEYISLGALKMHIRTHTLPCVCKSCGKAFSRPWLLQGHIRTHTGEKPYTCPHCSRAFADRSNLRAHLQTHSEVKKYPCRSCLKTFSRMSLLLRHEEASCSPAAT